jgi:hypothetical protein
MPLVAREPWLSSQVWFVGDSGSSVLITLAGRSLWAIKNPPKRVSGCCVLLELNYLSKINGSWSRPPTLIGKICIGMEILPKRCC